MVVGQKATAANMDKKLMINDVMPKYKIPFLLHFTSVDNIESIAKDGLRPRDVMDLLGGFKCCDDLRIDGFKSGISLSVGFPNYKMFYKYRKMNGGTWCVVAINPQIICNGKCLFFSENAASSKWRGRSPFSLQQKESFEEMFYEIDGKPTRATSGLPIGCPTNPQAEIIHVGPIRRDDFMGITFENELAMKEWEPRCNGIGCAVVNGFFKPRKDFQHWR